MTTQTSAKSRVRWVTPRLIALPVLYLLVLMLTAALSPFKPGGTFYRIIGVDPLGGAFMIVSDNAAVIIAVFAITGTPWWYVVGWVGWEPNGSGVSRLRSGLGAALALFTCWVSASMTVDVIRGDGRDRALTGVVILQYSLVALLCLGALASTISALINTLGGRREGKRQ
jgi:hypothetical protein